MPSRYNLSIQFAEPLHAKGELAAYLQLATISLRQNRSATANPTLPGGSQTLGTITLIELSIIGAWVAELTSALYDSPYPSGVFSRGVRNLDAPRVALSAAKGDL